MKSMTSGAADLGMFHIGIYVFNGVEVLDFAGPYEVFTTASRVFGLLNTTHDAPLFKVDILGDAFGTIRSRPGLEVNIDNQISDVAHLDVLIIPGGVVDGPLVNHQLLEWVKQLAALQVTIASVCNGALILAKTRLLDGMDVTTHWSDVEALQTENPALRVMTGERWIDQGAFLTSGGISAGMDMSLHLVRRLTEGVQMVPRDLAELTAHRMEYTWQQSATK